MNSPSSPMSHTSRYHSSHPVRLEGQSGEACPFQTTVQLTKFEIWEKLNPRLQKHLSPDSVPQGQEACSFMLMSLMPTFPSIGLKVFVGKKCQIINWDTYSKRNALWFHTQMRILVIAAQRNSTTLEVSWQRHCWGESLTLGSISLDFMP